MTEKAGSATVKPRGGKRRGKAVATAREDTPATARTNDHRRAARPLPDDPAAAPDFFCVGVQKGGTRWLYDQLQLHPDFWMPPVKELHYFDRRAPSAASLNLLRRAEESLGRTNRRQAKLALRSLDRRDIDFLAAYTGMTWWRTDLDAYARLFALKDGLISGDITPDYSTLSERTIARIMRRFPSAKVVFIARDPVERVWSHLAMHIRRGTLASGMGDGSVLRLLGKRFVVERSYPTKIAARWRKHVPDERFGLYLFDDLVADADGLRRRVVAFLGGDPNRESGTIPAAFNRKQEREKVALTPALRDQIARHFAAELKACGEVFGGAAKGWASRYGL